MDLAKVQKFRTAFINAKAPYTVVCDNEHLFKSVDHLFWNDAQQELICIRANNAIGNSNPVEIYVTEYDQIQGIYANTDRAGLDSIMTALALPNKTDVLENLDSRGLFNSSHVTRPTSYLGNNDR